MIPARITARPGTRLALGTHRLRRQYLDALGRPLTGDITISGGSQHAAGDQVVVPSTFNVPLHDGWLDVHLPAGTYSLSGRLANASGELVRPDPETSTLPTA